MTGQGQTTKLKPRTGLNKTLFWLYHGTGTWPFVFRWALLLFDALTIAYFLWAPFQDSERSHTGIDYVIGTVIAVDFLARLYIARSKGKFFRRITNWADLIVAFTMFAPLFTQNFAFLRILRAVRVVRAFTFLKRAKGVSTYLAEHGRIIERVTNLVVFVFIMAALVYVNQVGANVEIKNYIDALYFTVSSLTTTGYGDIVMEGAYGRLLSVVIMVLGLTLFLRLLRAIMRPNTKVEHECEACGLSRHDPDAVHCKHCGATVKIETEGRL